MSHAVVRGSPTAAQRYLDMVLTAAGSRDNLGQLLLHCLRTHPEDVMMINGHTGESFTNSWVLRRALRLSRALSAWRGRGAVTVAANHQHLMVANLAAVMAGVVPLGLSPGVTAFELQHFFSIWSPSVVFCDPEQRALIETAAKQVLKESPVIVLLGDIEPQEGTSLHQFIEGYSDSLDDFKVSEVPPDSLVILLPTSGSTGPPKAALLTHGPIIAQISTIWMHHSTFPRPVSRVLLLSNAQWMTWWSVMTSSLLYRITMVLMVSPTADVALDAVERYQIEWMLMSPSLSARALRHITAEKVKSLRLWLMTGATVAESTMAALQEHLQKGSYVQQSYGMTELNGFFSLPNKDTPFSSVGIANNIFRYKIVDDDGKELGPNEKGELYIKSKCVSKGYYNNEEASRDSLTADGWLRTGDMFYQDSRGQLFFVERIKFGFKYCNYQISPEEVETVINGVRGVEQSVVCGGERGAAALVVTSPGAHLTREEIHTAVNSTLAEYKRLHGGIAFVTSLPLTHSGKIKRRDCQALMEQLLKDQLCY